MTYPPQPPEQGGYHDPSWPSGQPGYYEQPAYDPYAQQPVTGPPAYPGYPAAGYGAPAPVRGTNTMALVGMILSLVGLAVAITAPVGAIMGHIAKKQIRETGEEGDGMALTAIIVGWSVTGLYVLCCGGYFLLIAGVIAAGGASTGGY